MEMPSELVSAAIVPGAATAAARAAASPSGEFAGLLQPALPPSTGVGQPVPVFPTVPAPVLVGPLTPAAAALAVATPEAEAVPTQPSPFVTNPQEAAPPAALMAMASPPEEISPGRRRGEAAAIGEDWEEPQALAVAAMSGEVPQGPPTSPASAGAAQAEVPSGELPAESVAEREHGAAEGGSGAPAAAPDGPAQPQAVTANVAVQGRDPQEPASTNRRSADVVADAPARLPLVPAVAEQRGGEPSLEPAARAMPAVADPAGAPTASAAAPAASATAPPALHPATPSAQASPVAEPQPAVSPATPRLNLDREFGERLGILITRQAGKGAGEVQIRMDPAELGRIHIRLSFDEGGSLRAVVGADSPQVLEAIRRDAGELGRALADAGVRTDAQSFRFDRGHQSGGGGGGGDLPRPWRQAQGDAQAHSGEHDDEPIRYRPLRGAGRVNLMA